jgi:hypothetical protein
LIAFDRVLLKLCFVDFDRSIESLIAICALSQVFADRHGGATLVAPLIGCFLYSLFVHGSIVSLIAFPSYVF